jgi:hypothetical protein
MDPNQEMDIEGDRSVLGGELRNLSLFRMGDC